MLDLQTENIRLRYVPLDTDTLVISFAHMDFSPSGDRFWGQDALLKAGFAVIGLACKTDCWYPRRDIERLSPHISRISSSYKNVVLYGFSMGGYAAVKFSKVMNATSALSFSPQFSIDPHDVGSVDRRLTHYFIQEKNLGMAIGPDDMQGSIFLFVDPYVALDVWNCDKIAGLAGNNASMTRINLPRIGHETVDAIARSATLSSIVRLSIEGNYPSIKRAMSQSRRATGRRIVNILSAVKTRQPSCAASLFKYVEPRLDPFWLKQWSDGNP